MLRHPRPGACRSALSASRPFLASAHAPEGVLLRASAHTSECVLLGPVGTAALSPVSPRARGRVCSGLRHTRPSACCSALSVLRLFFTSAHAPEGVLLRASACTAEYLLRCLVGAAALSHSSPRARGRVAPGFGVHGRVLVARPCRCCGSFSRQPTRPSACCSGLSALRLLPASAHAPEGGLLRAPAHAPGCVLLGLVGVAAPSRARPRAGGRVAPDFGPRARVLVARACRR